MDTVEAQEWLTGIRSMTNLIPREPFDTWQVRIVQADAAMMDQTNAVDIVSTAGEFLPYSKVCEFLKAKQNDRNKIVASVSTILGVKKQKIVTVGELYENKAREFARIPTVSYGFLDLIKSFLGFDSHLEPKIRSGSEYYNLKDHTYETWLKNVELEAQMGKKKEGNPTRRRFTRRIYPEPVAVPISREEIDKLIMDNRETFIAKKSSYDPNAFVDALLGFVDPEKRSIYRKDREFVFRALVVLS